jgi:mannose-6-phosphate isomerase-like protein (cupin superfamily)
MDYKNNIVLKPWGYEYLVYENEEVALWFLHINKGYQTSMHCHPKKSTGLILLKGEAELSFLADKRELKALDKVMIRRGLFHQTKALSEGGIDLFEIETPNDKSDLVRLQDKWGRKNEPYEGEKYESPKTDDCLWIEDLNRVELNHLSGCVIRTESYKTIEQMFSCGRENDIIVFLRGGLVRNIDGKQHLVTVPGDVGLNKIVKSVADQLDGLADNTFIMTIRKNER